MNWLLLIVLLWLLYRFIKILLRLLGELVKYASSKIPRSEAKPYGRINDRAAWLALAHPVFAAQDNLPLMVQPLVPGLKQHTLLSNANANANANALSALKPILLQYFGVRSNTSAAEVKQKVEKVLRHQWYRLDMKQLTPQDDLQDALAFATARLTFAVRAAALLGWVPLDLHWQVLQLNAQRATDCFSSWGEYGHAYARGRKQWIIRNRSDSLGMACSETDVDQWLKSRLHPWCRFNWMNRPA